jgi:hypothetical protein
MASGYIKIKREQLVFTFYLEEPIEERKKGNYAMIKNGNLYLALGAHYIMFRLDKELDSNIQYNYPMIEIRYYADIWNKIVSNDQLNVSYNPCHDVDGIIHFTIYISLDSYNHYELVMAMDMYYNPVHLHLNKGDIIF